MNWSEMDTTLTHRAKEILELRDRAKAFHDALMAPMSLVEFETTISLRYGVGVLMTVTGDNGRVVRVSLYPNKILAYMGTHDAQGNRAKKSGKDHLLKEVVSYLHGVPT